MKNLLIYIKHHPSVLLYMLLSWILFGLITTTLTIFPLLSDYVVHHPSVFLVAETWTTFLSYTYNATLGGIVNYMNTFLFGFWVLCFVVYRRTYIAQGVSIAESIRMHKFASFGSLVALLGGGCIGCGVTFLTTIFGATLGSILVALPYQGAEISILGGIIMLVSIIRVVKQISQFRVEQTTSQNPVMGI